MGAILFYLKFLASVLWVFVVSCVYLVVALFNRRSPGLFTETVHAISVGVLPILGIKVVVEGSEHLSDHQPCVYIGNHQSALDVPIYGFFCPKNSVAIGKKELVYIPLFGWLFKLTGGILIDRQNRSRAFSQIDAGVKAIKERGVSIGILPEGTRNRSGKGLLPFKKGAFHLAVAAQVPIVPIVVAEFGHLVNTQKRRIKKGTIRVRVLPPLSTQGLNENDIAKLTSQAQDLMAEHLKLISDPTRS